jgi:hypothetical protein
MCLLAYLAWLVTAGLFGALFALLSEKVVHPKTAAAANMANAITMTVTRRLAEGPEGGAPDNLSTPDHLHDLMRLGSPTSGSRRDLSPRPACPSRPGTDAAAAQVICA